MIALALLWLALFQTDLPYKAEEEFTVKFALSFNKRNDPIAKDRRSSGILAPTYEPADNSPLPFMQVTLEVLTQQPEEIKLKIIRDKDVLIAKKKIKTGVKEVVFSDFVDDVKDQIGVYNHTIYFLNKEGDAISRIVIEFDDEGFYFVNGKRKGKL